MMRLRLQKLDQKGFSWHFILPVLVIAAVAGIGSYLLTSSHAATAGCESYAFDYKAQTMTLPESSTPTTDVKTTNSNFGACMAYIERTMNIAYATNYDGFAVYADGFKDTAPATVQVKGFIGLSNPSVWSWSVDGKFSPNLLNRVHAFQNFFAYGTTDATVDSRVAPYKSGTTWNPSTTELVICGIDEHTTSTVNSYNTDAAGLATHYGCAAGASAPTWRSSIKAIDKPPVGSIALACATNGTGGVKFGFSDPNGNTSATLTVTYIPGVSPATSVNAYSASGTYTLSTAIPAADVAGNWSAKLVVDDLWGTQAKTFTASHTTCKPATTSSGGGGTSSGGGSGSSGCTDVTNPACYNYVDPCTADPASCASDPTQYDSTCDTSCYDANDYSDSGSTGGDTGSSGNSGDSSSTYDSGLYCDPTDPTCSGSSSSDQGNVTQGSSTGSASSKSHKTSGTSGSKASKSNFVVSFFHGVRTVLNALF